LGSRAAALLELLIERQSKLVTKDEIFAAVWPGMAVEEANLTVQISALRRVLDQDRKQGSCIQTVPGRGYRFVLPIIRTSAPSGLATKHGLRTPLTLPDKPSIAVLPFVNLSDDPEQEYFADGISEDFITALSRYPSLFVIARNSSFAYKGRTVNVKDVGHELGVRYVLEGGLRKYGNRIRITAQLVDADTGKHIWAERYDRDLADIFAVQDDITQAATIAIAPAVAAAERQRAMRMPPGSLDAWAAYQRGLWHFYKITREDNALAESYFQQAIDIDPNCAAGYKGLAWVQVQATGVLATRTPAVAHGSAEVLARHAVALDSTDAEARATLSEAMLWSRGDYEGALAEGEQARSMSPNLAFAHATLGAALIFSGHPKDGLAALQMSLRLDPQDPWLPNRLNTISVVFTCPANTKPRSRCQNGPFVPIPVIRSTTAGLLRH
jgi:adenylate cyclase